MRSKPCGAFRTRSRTRTSGARSRSGRKARSSCPAASLRLHALSCSPLHGGIVLCALLLSGCSPEPVARVTLAEFQDETPDGTANQDETIVLHLDRALEADRDLTGIRISSEDLGSSDLEVAVGEDRRHLIVKIRTGRPAFRFAGVHGRQDGASGLTVDLGDGIPQTVDLQIRHRTPNLIDATWIDGSGNAAPNGVVDRGDRLRLRFDGRVRLSGDPQEVNAVEPSDVRLSKDGVDKLDDDLHRSTWRASDGDRDDEVDIELGSRPILHIEGTLTPPLGIDDRDRPDAPSGLAINGTDVRPMRAIESAGGGPGVASDREVDIRMPQEIQERLERFADKRDWIVHDHGTRAFHSLTPFLGRYAMVAGGRDPGNPHRVLRDVFLLTTPWNGTDDVDLVDTYPLRDLPNPTFQHTATLLPGNDRKPGTQDDLVVIAGGMVTVSPTLGDRTLVEAERTLDDLTVVYFEEGRKELQVKWLSTKLKIPRAEHAAVAVRHDQILIDGGRSTGRGVGRGAAHSGLVEVAELLTIRRVGDNILVENHETFRSLARRRHSLTLLAPDSDSPRVLAFGGIGRNPDRPRANDDNEEPAPRFGHPVNLDSASSFSPEKDAVVLYCPTIIHVDKPRDSIEKLQLEKLLPEFLRHGHRALGLGEPGDEGLVESEHVVIFGGTLLHPSDNRESREYYERWEISGLQYLFDLKGENGLPREDAALAGIEFRLHPRDPLDSSRSLLSVLPHPAPRPETLLPRENFSMTEVPGLGVVIAGGEGAREVGGPPRLLSTVEIYFTSGEHKGELRELAWSLNRPRSGHQAYLVERDGRRFLFLVGGRTPADPAGGEPRPGTEVEVFPLP